MLLEVLAMVLVVMGVVMVVLGIVLVVLCKVLVVPGMVLLVLGWLLEVRRRVLVMMRWRLRWRLLVRGVVPVGVRGCMITGLFVGLVWRLAVRLRWLHVTGYRLLCLLGVVMVFVGQPLLPWMLMRVKMPLLLVHLLVLRLLLILPSPKLFVRLGRGAHMRGLLLLVPPAA